MFKLSFTIYCNENSLQDNAVGHFSSLKVAQVREFSSSMTPVPKSKWEILKDIMNMSVLIAGAAYSLHYLYR